MVDGSFIEALQLIYQRSTHLEAHTYPQRVRIWQRPAAIAPELILFSPFLRPNKFGVNENKFHAARILIVTISPSKLGSNRTSPTTFQCFLKMFIQDFSIAIAT
jgi:hypothetical protein